MDLTELFLSYRLLSYGQFVVWTVLCICIIYTNTIHELDESPLIIMFQASVSYGN